MNRIQAIDAPVQTTDGELLRRFLERREDAAFAELVARHGPMVYGVCFRRLGQCQDAEDCFQAVFLAMAQQAAELLDRPNVGPWLYTVARRVSGKGLLSRRRRRWVFWGKTPEPAAEALVEVDVDLDAALATLTEPERSAVVLCHLEGLSRAEAASALAIPEGTLSARLSRALEKLRRKLGKQPLAVLAAATAIMLPERLPASTVGLVHHWREGALDDWASPRVLELYRKARPMRLLDRVGPAVAGMAAAVLIMFGGFAGWQLITAQPPAEAKGNPPSQAAAPSDAKKSFAAAVDELQTGKPETAAKAKWLAQLHIKSARSFGGAQGFPWSITLTETIDGAKVEHFIHSWPSLEPFLRQVTLTQQVLQVLLEHDAVSRLEANQVVNVAKRAGFKTLDYRGPPLFGGRDGDSMNAFADKLDMQAIQANLTDASNPFPDWTNGWGVDVGRIVRLDDDAANVTWAEVGAGVDSVRPEGPAALISAIRRMNKTNVAGKKTRAVLEKAAVEQEAAVCTRRVVSVSAYLQAKEPGVSLEQQFKTGAVGSRTGDIGAAAVILERTAKATGGGRFDVRVGPTDTLQAETTRETTVNPLFVNRLLNALKRGGAAEIHYWGQQLFTGQRDYSPGIKTDAPRKVVKLVLQPQRLDGELPDEGNGWVTFYWTPAGGAFILRATDRNEFAERMKAGIEDPWKKGVSPRKQ